MLVCDLNMYNHVFLLGCDLNIYNSHVFCWDVILICIIHTFFCWDVILICIIHTFFAGM